MREIRYYAAWRVARNIHIQRRLPRLTALARSIDWEGADIAKFYYPGTKVTFINDYGVSFPGKIIVGIDNSVTWKEHRQIRYFIAPTDTPWFSVNEKNLYREYQQDWE